MVSTTVPKDGVDNSAIGNFDTTQIPLAELATGEGINFGAQTVTINGELLVNNVFVLGPTTQPTNAVAGQMYYDQTSNLLNYYNGTEFVPLSATSTTSVESVGGGLTLTGGQLSNAGVLSVQGQTGNVSLTAGDGIGINGTTISNTGVVGLTSANSNLTVANNGGNYELTVNLGGAGVTSVNGLSGALTVANASGVGTTITIDDASTSAKGIAQFNPANFSAAGGTVNTIQDIGTGATPTFVGVNTNAITPSGTLTVGAIGQQLTLQGNASTQLTANSGGFATALGFTGVPVGNVTYTLDRTLAGGTYEICTSIGNCVGGGTTLQQAYDAGSTITTTDNRTITIELADTATDANFLVDLQCDTACSTNGRFALQDDTVDIFSVAPTAITVGSATTNVPVTISSGTGAINIGDGAQARTVNVGTGAAAQTTTLGSTNTTSTTLIQGGSGNITLNSGGTIALQDTTTIAGNLTVTGTATSALVVKASTNGSTALVVDFQQSDSDSIMRLTDTGTIGLGNSSGIAGILALSSGTAFGEIRATNVTAARVLQLPNQDGTFCVSNAGTTNCETSLQRAYDASTGGTTPEIKLDTTRNGIEIQDANSTIGSGQNFLSMRGPNAGGLGNVLVGFGTQGNLFMQPSTNRTDLVDINTSGGANLFTIDSSTSTGRVGIALTGTTLPSYTLDVGGDANLITGSVYRINGTAICSISGCTAASGSGNYIQNGTSQQTANFNIVSAAAASNAALIQGAASASTPITVIRGGATPGAGAHLLTLQDSTTTGLFWVNNAGALSFAGTGTATFTTPDTSVINAKISIASYDPGANGQMIATGIPAGASTSARAISLFDARTTNHQPTIAVFSPNQASAVGFTWNGSDTTAVLQTTDDNANGGTSESLSIQTGAGTGTNTSSGSIGIDVGAKTGAGTTGVVTIGGTNASAINLGYTSGSVNVTTTVRGLTVLRPRADNAAVLQVQDAGGTDFFTVNSLTANVVLGKASVATGRLQFQGSGSANAVILTGPTSPSNNTITLPNETGTVCTNASICTGYASTTSSIQNQNAGAQTASNFWISGSGRADTSFLVPTLDTATAAALNIGTTNATVINLNENAAVAADKTLTVTSALTTLTGATTGDALNVSNSTSTGNIAVFKDNATAVATIANGGAVLFQNETDSTTAFRILNTTGSGAVPQFVVDTSNSRTYIGNPTADTTGALLVLDTKNSAADPTGVDGGMYYNSALGTFRCYEDSKWTECLGEPKPNTNRTTKFVANGDDEVWQGYGDVLTNTGPAGSGGSVSGNLVPSVYNDTAASIGSAAGVSSGNPIYSGDRLIYQTHLDTTQASVRLWAGFTDQDLATMAASATPTGSFAAFRYDTGAGDAAWKCITNDGVSATTADSTVAIADDQKFEIILDAGVRAVFKINGQTVCNVTTTLPSSVLHRVVNSITALNAAIKTIYVGWIYVEGDPL